MTSLKQIDDIAAAVYGPIPGNSASSLDELGNSLEYFFTIIFDVL